MKAAFACCLLTMQLLMSMLGFCSSKSVCCTKLANEIIVNVHTYWPHVMYIWPQSLHECILNDSILCNMPHGDL